MDFSSSELAHGSRTNRHSVEVICDYVVHAVLMEQAASVVAIL